MLHRAIHFGFNHFKQSRATWALFVTLVVSKVDEVLLNRSDQILNRWDTKINTGILDVFI